MPLQARTAPLFTTLLVLWKRMKRRQIVSLLELQSRLVSERVAGYANFGGSSTLKIQLLQIRN